MGTDLTLQLEAAASGDREALAAAYATVYAELKRVAGALLRGRDDTLSPTVLVNEAFLRLCGGPGRVSPVSRRHFFATAAQAMRWIITDLARQRLAQCRGGDLARVELDEQWPAPQDDAAWLALDGALDRLGEVDPDKRELVELRFFAGLEYPELAVLLGRSERSLKRDWAAARALLGALLEEP